MEVFIDTRIKTAVNFHDALHVFCACLGMGMAIMEIKMAQDLDRIYQDPLLLVLLDLWKAYDMLDCGCLLQTL